MALRQKPTAVKNPTPFVISNPTGIDEIITSLQTEFTAKLSWLTKSFGKASMMYKEKQLGEGQTEDILFPGIFIEKEKDPLILLSSDNFTAYTFSYITGAAEAVDPEAHISTEFQRPLSVIFWFNLHEVDPTKDYPFQEELAQEIDQIIANTSFEGINGVEILNYITIPQEIFAEWSVELVKNQFLIYPNAGIRFNLNAFYRLEQDCS